jgi:PEP-CTERM motif
MASNSADPSQDGTERFMRNTFGPKVVYAALVLATAPLALSGAASADTNLLSLTDSGAQTDTAYSFNFVATDMTETISFGGYQLPAWETVTAAAVRLDGAGQNLLYSQWTFTAATKGSYAATFKDGSSVPGLLFGGLSAGNYDTFSQVVSTVVGESYTLSFLYSNYAGPSGLLVSYHPDGSLPGGSGSGQSTGVPEPSTWALTLLGFAALGYAMQNRKYRKIALADA